MGRDEDNCRFLFCFFETDACDVTSVMFISDKVPSDKHSCALAPDLVDVFRLGLKTNRAFRSR